METINPHIDNPMDKNNLINIATNVLAKYNIQPLNITIIQSGGIKTVWKVSTDKGLLCLKRLKQTLDKALFSTNAQVFIKNSNGYVPSIIRDTDQNLIVSYNGELFVLYEWINGRDLNFGDPNDLREALLGLAKFHNSSKGYKAPTEAKISSKLGNTPSLYESMMNKFITWKEESKGYEDSCHQSYVKYVDGIIDICKLAIHYINNSSYKDMVKEGSQCVVLCHQDYGKGNAVLTDQGVCVIDLDGVTFDHPSRDLRKIIGKLSENKGIWQEKVISDILQTYQEVNPLDSSEKELLYIDLLYPHWFYGLVKNIFKNNKIISSSKIEKIAKLELSKVELLKSLLGTMKI